MRTIFKYLLRAGKNLCPLPKGAEFLSIEVQNGEAILYAIVDDEENKTVTRSIFGALTGMTLPNMYNKDNFLGTAMTDNGRFVIHFFDHDKAVHMREFIKKNAAAMARSTPIRIEEPRP